MAATVKDLAKIIKDIGTTKMHLTSMKLSALGWEAGNIEGAARLIGPHVRVYVNDFRTEWQWVCSVPLDQALAVTQRAHDETKMWQAFRDGVATCLDQTSAAHREGTVTTEQENILVQLLLAYAGTTKTWDLANRFKGGGDFIVHRYKRGLLRPFFIDNGELLSVASFFELSNQVLATDRQRHPDWLIA